MRQRVFLAAVIALAILMMASPTSSYAAKGVVVLKLSSCDWYIVDAPGGYALLEWYGGNEPERGDVIAGDFESYGFKDLYNLTSDDELRVWVEDYWLGKADALEQISEQCD